MSTSIRFRPIDSRPLDLHLLRRVRRDRSGSRAHELGRLVFVPLLGKPPWVLTELASDWNVQVHRIGGSTVALDPATTDQVFATLNGNRIDVGGNSGDLVSWSIVHRR